jgi:hypothetical protein
MNENFKNILLASLGCVCNVTKLLIEEYVISSDEDIVDDMEIIIQMRIHSNISPKIGLFNELADLDYRSHFRITKESTEVVLTRYI